MNPEDLKPNFSCASPVFPEPSVQPCAHGRLGQACREGMTTGARPPADLCRTENHPRRIPEQQPFDGDSGQIQVGTGLVRQSRTNTILLHADNRPGSTRCSPLSV
jgi:hypothetical protein